MPGGGKRSLAELIVIGPSLYAAGSVMKRQLWRMTVDRVKRDTTRAMEEKK